MHMLFPGDHPELTGTDLKFILIKENDPLSIITKLLRPSEQVCILTRLRFPLDIVFGLTGGSFSVTYVTATVAFNENCDGERRKTG